MKIFAGPCLLESEEMCFEVAETISKYIPDGVDYYFKASFSKANRSSHNSFTGHGYDFAIDVFEKLRKSGYKVITDVHDVVDVSLFSNYVDAFQIPAFLCRQNNLLQAVAESGKLVNVKKGQFLSLVKQFFLVKRWKHMDVKTFISVNVVHLSVMTTWWLTSELFIN